MIFASGHSIYWRLTDDRSSGADAISVVLTNSQREDLAEVTVEKEMVPAIAGTGLRTESVDIEWNRRDLELFLTLLRRTLEDPEEFNELNQIELDLTDESIVQILQIVAAARFARPHPATPIINTRRALPGGGGQAQLGELISIDTIDSLKPAIVVAVTDKDLHCVLLDEITSPGGDNIRFDRHDIIVLPRQLALPGSFTNLIPDPTDLIH